MSRAKRADAAVPERQPRSFDETFRELNLTPAERRAMVWHLAMYRARKTVEALLISPDAKDSLGFDPKDILRSALGDGR